MESGEWSVASGAWRLESGWVVSGERSVASEWTIEWGRRVERGMRRIENRRWMERSGE